MKNALVVLAISVVLVQVVGCRSMSHARCRAWTPRQLDVLRTFALQESPTLWQTLQALRAEREMADAGLKSLRADLLEFGRTPEADEDYVELKSACEGIDRSLEDVCSKLEEAYIAYKKQQASPECGAIMRQALEDGLLEADFALRRYNNLTKRE